METKDKETTLTGYPSIDKPWLKYYDRDFLQKPLPQMTILEYLKYNSGQRNELIALTYFGKKISYAELFKNIDRASKVFTGIGIKEGDRIMFLMPNIPETAYMLYGASQIGAVSDFIDPRPDSVDMTISAEKIYGLVKNEKINYIVALEQCYAGMLSLIEDKLLGLGINEIIIVSASASMDKKAKINFIKENLDLGGLEQLKVKLNKQKNVGKLLKQTIANSKLNILKYQDLINKYDQVEIKPVPYRPDRLIVIVHTSGTTSSQPKPIPLTDDNLNCCVHSSFGAGILCGEGDIELHLLPYFAAYGIANVTHNALCRGANLIQIPEFTIQNFGQLILKYKPQIIVGVPTWYLSLLENSKMQNANLSFLKELIFGGDSMEIADEKRINDFLHECQCNINLTKGHGMSETSGGASFATGEYNDLGSLGIPFPHTVYALIDPDARKMLRFEEEQEYIEGELIISSKAVTLGGLDGKELVPHVQYDGVDYIRTGDLVQMDRNGKMKFLSRKDRGFTRFDGYKIKPFEIENIIKGNEKVNYCVIAPYKDTSKHGNMPMAHIVLKDPINVTRDRQIEIVEEIVNSQFVLNPDVSARQIPTKFRFRDSLPFTVNGKLDHNAIIREGLCGDEICVDWDETILSLGEIKIT